MYVNMKVKKKNRINLTLLNCTNIRRKKQEKTKQKKAVVVFKGQK